MPETIDLQTLVKANQLNQATAANIQAWLANSQLTHFHDAIKTLIRKQDWTALNDAFYNQIEFGTAGLRGRTGIGSARINSWTVGAAAQGLANYILAQDEAAKTRGVVVGSDTRLTSPEFGQLVTDILTSHGIKVFRFARPTQVGMFSYAVRLKKAMAGVYISASHNPPTDNGLKIYWEDGAQVLPPRDKAITEAVGQVTAVKKDTPDPNLISEIGDDFDSAYRARVLEESVSYSRSAKIVYSPLHGTGQYGVLPILQEAGFSVVTVDEQMTPDGHFPNVPGGVPNPQNKESNALTAAKVLATDADLGISTDPDADRIGLIVPQGDSTAILDGNQTVMLLAYFICQRLKANHKLPKNGFLVRTFVTNPILDAIATDFQLAIYRTPVGFKYIGAVISQHEDFGDQLYVYGGEESWGSLKGSYTHDKDASSASLIAAEMVSWLKDQNRTVWDYFNEIYQRYGYYHNDAIDLKFDGAEGFGKIQRLMASLRANPPVQIGDWPVVSIHDYQTMMMRQPAGASLGQLEGHSANMLIFNLSEDGKNNVTVRPSGTETKIKLYLSLYNPKPDIEKSVAQADRLKEALTATVHQRVQST